MARTPNVLSTAWGRVYLIWQAHHSKADGSDNDLCVASHPGGLRCLAVIALEPRVVRCVQHWYINFYSAMQTNSNQCMSTPPEKGKGYGILFVSLGSLVL